MVVSLGHYRAVTGEIDWPISACSGMVENVRCYRPHSLVDMRHVVFLLVADAVGRIT